MRLAVRLFSDHLIGALLCPLQHSPTPPVPLSAPHYRHQRRPLFGQALSAVAATSLLPPFAAFTLPWVFRFLALLVLLPLCANFV